MTALSSRRVLGCLRSHARRWGGAITVLAAVEIEPMIDAAYQGKAKHLCPAPYEGGIVTALKQRTIYVRADIATTCPWQLIHEMGHVFGVDDDDFDTAEEWEFFGWEIAMARRARCYRAWSGDNYYITDDGYEWRSLTDEARARHAAERLDWAMATGIVSQDGRPLLVRGRGQARAAA